MIDTDHDHPDAAPDTRLAADAEWQRLRSPAGPYVLVAVLAGEGVRRGQLLVTTRARIMVTRR